MQAYLACQNIQRFRELLKAERQDVRRQVLLSLIAGEEAKLLQLAKTSSTDIAGSVMNCADLPEVPTPAPRLKTRRSPEQRRTRRG
jgi:hypothetical protein